MCNMQSIGIRELRQHASRYLRRVQAGETLQVTDRGRPVALMVPPPAPGGYAAAVASGRVTSARGSLLELAPPPARRGARGLSQALEELRRDER